MKRKIMGLLLLMLSTQGFAATNNLKIRSIEIANNKAVPYEIIKSNISMKEGDAYSTDRMLLDFNKLKNLGYFEDVVIEPVTSNGEVDLVINVVEKQNVSSILSQQGIASSQERDDVDKSMTVSEIHLSGNKKVPTADLLKIINIKSGEYFSKSKVEEAQRKLLQTGYFKSVTPNANVKPGKIGITFNVTENPTINDIVITGSTVFSAAELKNLLSSKTGEIQNYNNLEADRDKILEAYNSKGYTLVNLADMSVDENGTLNISVVEGIVRKIEVRKMVTKQKGNRRKPTDDVLKTQTYVIDREVEIVPGQIFNNEQYQATVDNLMRLGIFKNIQYEARSIPGDPQGVDLILLIDEDRTAMLQGALSYGSEIGLMGTLSLKDNNWRGKGQEFGITYEKSNKDYTGFNIDFFDPWIKGTDRVSWGWGAYKTEYGDDDSPLFYDMDTLGLKANIGKGLGKNWRLSIGGKVEYVKEKHRSGHIVNQSGKWYYTNYKDAAGKNIEVDGVDDKYYIWSIYPYISYDTRNHYLNPTRGTYGKLQVEYGHAGGYKADYFGNVTIEARKYHRGLFKNNSFAYRLIAGVMTDTTKESQRFWVGGGNSLRGYDGGTFKGKEKVVLNIENRTQFNDIFGLVAFADIGRAWNQKGRDASYKNDSTKFGDDIAVTAGVGVRLNTPLGPLRFDFGWPVGSNKDKYDDDNGMKFYFNMGHAF